MDPLRQDDLERARATPPGEKGRQALEAMATGVRLKRAGLRARHPQATEAELDKLLERWLAGDE
jgi:hypothetical protein